ncbi:hypothetical protein TcG_13275 [Trypanosoma cruzi]|nr:hypothetical protein TcG_13275 [Trypanosoma cruzi]
MVAPNVPVKHAQHPHNERYGQNTIHKGNKSRLKRRGLYQRLWRTACVNCETAPTQQTHTPPATHNGQGEEATHRHRLQFNPTANGIRSQPAAGTQRTRSKQSPKEPNAEADPHPPMTRRLSTRGHTERTFSRIDLILRPSR